MTQRYLCVRCEGMRTSSSAGRQNQKVKKKKKLRDLWLFSLCMFAVVFATVGLLRVYILCSANNAHKTICGCAVWCDNIMIAIVLGGFFFLSAISLCAFVVNHQPIYHLILNLSTQHSTHKFNVYVSCCLLYIVTISINWPQPNQIRRRRKKKQQ